MHEFEQAEIDGGVLLGAVELLEEPHAAGALAEEADQHAVLRPDLAVLARQVLHDVVGAWRRARIWRLSTWSARSAGGARVDLELLDRLRDLIHQLARRRRATARRASRPSSSSSDAAARISGFAATVTRSTETCGEIGAGVIGCGAARGCR